MSSSTTALHAPTRCLRLVAWGNAVLLGRASPDTAADRVVAGDLPHRVQTVPGGCPDTLTVALARLSTQGVRGLRLVLPAPGDPVGLPGPGGFSTGAMGLGAGVLVESSAGGLASGLLPAIVDAAVLWTAHEVPAVAALPVPSLAEAERELAVAVREATDLLDRLDLARWDPTAAPALEALRDGRLDGDLLAPGYPGRAVKVLAQARRMAALVELALTCEGAAVTAGQTRARRAALVPLERAARHAQVAAANAVLEPDT